MLELIFIFVQIFESLEAHSFEKVHPSMSSAQIERNQTSEATQSAGSTSTGWSQLHTTTPQTGNNSQVSKGAGPSVFVENDPDKSKQDNTLKNSIFMNLGKQGSAEYGEEVKVPVKKVQDDGGDFRVGEVKVKNVFRSFTSLVDNWSHNLAYQKSSIFVGT